MGKTQDEAQEIVLRQMEKVSKSASRKGERDSEDDYNSLASQLKRQAAHEKLSIEQRRALVPRRNWEEALIKYVVKDKNMCTNSMIKNLLSKRRSNFDEFHQTGLAFPEIVPFITEQLQKL